MSGVAVRFRALLLPQRQGAARDAAPAPISICRRWRAIWKRGCGTTCSFSRRTICGIPHGTIRATVLIETILAAFEMDEILYELRDHSAGLNCGRWDYIFSFIKKFRNRADFMLPDRALVTMDRAFPAVLRRSADPDLPPARHPRHGRDGGADSHQERSGGQRSGARKSAPGQAARSQGRARRHLGGASGPGADREGNLRRIHDEPNQIDVKREDVQGHREGSAEGARRRDHRSGLHWNIDVGLQYLEAWLAGIGCVPIYNLMEDAATAEISRAQVWQWLHNRAKTDTGKTITPELVHEVIAEEAKKLSGRPHIDHAAKLLDELIISDQFADFMPLVAYQYV